jgi:Carboxypeptidase regulatory-like domain
MVRLCIFAVLLTSTLGVNAQSISGVIDIERTLTRKSVTSAIPLYQRGAVVKLGEQSAHDPLDYERSHVVVYIENIDTPGAAPLPPAAFSMPQLNRQFATDLLVVPAGATVSFPNLDPIFHNIFSLSKPRSFDLGSYDKGETRTVKFPKPGVVYVYCHLHPNMEGTVFVAPSGWFTQADASGRYTIKGVPPGRYTLVAWHKKVGFFRKTIVVEDGQETTANFVLPFARDPESTPSSVSTTRSMAEGR